MNPLHRIQEALVTAFIWSGCTFGVVLMVMLVTVHDPYLFGQVAVMGVGWLALLLGLDMVAILVHHALDHIAKTWWEGDDDTPLYATFFGYMEDHAMGIDKIDQWSCGRRTLLHDIQFVQYLAKRWCFYWYFHVYSGVGAWWYRLALATPEERAFCI